MRLETIPDFVFMQLYDFLSNHPQIESLESVLNEYTFKPMSFHNFLGRITELYLTSQIRRAIHSGLPLTEVKLQNPRIEMGYTLIQQPHGAIKVTHKGQDVTELDFLCEYPGERVYIPLIFEYKSSDIKLGKKKKRSAVSRLYITMAEFCEVRHISTDQIPGAVKNPLHWSLLLKGKEDLYQTAQAFYDKLYRA